MLHFREGSWPYSSIKLRSRLGKLAGDKSSSLFPKFVNYRKKIEMFVINSLFLVSYTISEQFKTIFANEMGKLTKKLEYFRTKRVIGTGPKF